MANKRRVFLFCSQCTKKRKIRYTDTIYESVLNCNVCKSWLGKIEFDGSRGNPYYQWPIAVGSRPSDEVIQELGL